MIESVLTVVACAALFAAFGFMNRGRDGSFGCGHCDGTCADESECKVHDLGEVRS
jgi:hypothetical protein